MKKTIFLIIVASLLVSTPLAQSLTFTEKSDQPLSVLFDKANLSTTETVISVTAPTTTVDVGSEFNVSLNVSDTTGRGIIAYQFDLHYNPSVIRPQANAVEVAGTISSGLSAVFNPNTPGLLKVVVYGAYPLSGTGTLLNFKFVAVGPAASTSPLSFTNFMFNEGNPGSTVLDGQIRIAPRNISGVPSSFTGWEIPRGKSFVLTSDDHINSASLSVSYDTVAGSQPGCDLISNGYWTMMIYSNGNYVGSLYGDISFGTVRDFFDGTTGDITERRTKVARFRILGGKDGYEYVQPEETGSLDFSSRTKYTNGRKTTATLTNVL
ncbi:MAG TPA: cohesin domain-containing protein [Pyrinomonadaceae bacterium]|jgi:hypothetical protein|nr:cohesin domain-containing protein [Pyrinomonadaceae bacterium]